jgi:hypothetical protein
LDANLTKLLYQLPKGPKYPNEINYISFASRSLQERERRYSTTKRELLAIVFALNRFHYYLWGRHFELFTDHKALMYIHSQPEWNAMLTNWQETILNYTFTIIYRPGILNILPDALSRLYPTDIKKIPSKHENQIIISCLHFLQDDQTIQTEVEQAKRSDILFNTHAMGHIGANTMVNSIHEQGLTWLHLSQTCLDFIKRCRECQRLNITKKGYHPMKAINAQLPGEHLAIDLAGPLPTTKSKNVRLLVVVDVCTRFVFLRALPNKNGITIVTALWDLLCTIGFPKIIQSDYGKEFVNNIIKIMTTKMNIEQRLITPYHPRGNGVAENHVKTTIQMIRKEVKAQGHRWDEHLPFHSTINEHENCLSAQFIALFTFLRKTTYGFSNYCDEKTNPMSQLTRTIN